MAQNLIYEADFAQDSGPFLQAISNKIEAIDDLSGYQEKLQADLDQVELDLMTEVSRQSSLFASALTVIQALQDEMEDLVVATEQIQGELRPWAETVRADKARMDALVAEERAICAIRRQLQSIDGLLRDKGRIQELVDGAQFDEAMSLIETVEGRLAEEGLESFGPLKGLLQEFDDIKVALGKLKLANVSS